MSEAVARSVSGRDSTDATDGVLRVLVSDSRPVVRAGFVALLARICRVEASDLESVSRLVDEFSPRVLLAGLRVDDPTTFSTVAKARSLLPDLKVLVVADAATVIDLREAVIAGVDSFLLTSAPDAELREAVVRTARGERMISPSIAMQLADTGRREPQPGASALTPRELEVLQLLAEGLTNEQVGRRLGLPSRTVKTHVQHLLVKLDARDRTGAVARGFRLGMVR